MGFPNISYKSYIFVRKWYLKLFMHKFLVYGVIYGTHVYVYILSEVKFLCILLHIYIYSTSLLNALELVMLD